MKSKSQSKKRNEKASTRWEIFADTADDAEPTKEKRERQMIPTEK